jgi:F-type H+-transporting ATPase subunit a
MLDPLHQFQIRKIIPLSLGSFDISYTNSALWMTIGLGVVCLFFYVSLRPEALVPGRLQASAELAFTFLSDMVKTYIGREGLPFFPFIFTLFWFVLMGNLLGLLPYSFTYTSHIIVTFSLAIVAFLAANVAGFKKHGLKMFHLFLPKGIPVFLAPLMVIIEFISYIARPFSLSIRLFANMMAGHLILKLFASFSMMLAQSSLAALGVVPLLLNIGVTGLEFLVAVLQTYVFTLLTCLYINDAINLH